MHTVLKLIHMIPIGVIIAVQPEKPYPSKSHVQISLNPSSSPLRVSKGRDKVSKLS